jgi:vacuolar-type H+-ATPase subunit H
MKVKKKNKKIFKTMKNALVFFKKKDINKVNQEIRQKRIKLIANLMVNPNTLKDVKKKEKEARPLIEKQN